MTAIPYQKCPKCDGQGTVCKPPYVAGDQYTWSSSAINFVCDVCEGRKIIPMFAPQNKCSEKETAIAFAEFLEENYTKLSDKYAIIGALSGVEYSLSEVFEVFKERDI